MKHHEKTEITDVEVESAEVVEEFVFEGTLDELEKDFNAFQTKVEQDTSSMSSNLNMDELNEIGDEIIKAKEYLTSFARGEKKSIREKAYNQLIALPLIGDWAKERVEDAQLQAVKDSGVKEVLESIFDNFDVKKKRLIELTYLAEEIKGSLIEQEIQNAGYIQKLDYIINTTDNAGDKMRALDMANQAEASDKIIKDQVYNKLQFIIEMMEQLMMKMSKTLPAMKAQLLNETSIAGMIQNISDAVKMMGSLQSLTNEIAQTSTENIQGMIISVTNDLSNGTDIEYYKKSAERNAKFQETMKNARVKQIETTVNTYNALKDIGVNTSNQLENRLNAERLALGLQVENMKESHE